MKKPNIGFLALAFVFLLPVTSAQAQFGGLLNQVDGNGTKPAAAPGAASSATSTGILGALGGGSGLVPGSLGNVVGLLKFCIENNYLGGSAKSVQSTLKGRLGSSPASNPAYASGLVGILDTGNGKTMNLGGNTAQPIAQQMCTRILAQAKSFL